MNSNQYKCETCGKIFPRKFNLKRHFRVHQPNVENVVCNVCSKSFANDANLKTHLIYIHGVNEMMSTTPEKVLVPNRGEIFRYKIEIVIFLI